MFVCVWLALKVTSMLINPSVGIGLLSKSDVTQSFTLVTEFAKKGGVGSQGGMHDNSIDVNDGRP